MNAQQGRLVLLGLLAVTSMLLVGCGSEDSAPAAASPDDRVSASATSEAPAESPLEGTWRTGPISLRDAEATLRRQGFAEWIEKFRETPPFSTGTVLVLSIEGGQWNLYGESEGRREPIDYDVSPSTDHRCVFEPLEWWKVMTEAFTRQG